MFVKIVTFLTMFSMSANGFLPRSITDLSGNSFLVDAIACQTVFLDFLHFSDRSLVEIAVQTVDDLSVAAPLSSVEKRAVFSASATPWASVCRMLAQSIEQEGTGLTETFEPVSPKGGAPATPSMDNTTSDYILLNAVARTLSRGYALTSGGVSLGVSRLLSSFGERGVNYPLSGQCAGAGTPQAMTAIPGLIGRDVPVFVAGHYSSFLPRSGIEATVTIRGIL